MVEFRQANKSNSLHCCAGLWDQELEGRCSTPGTRFCICQPMASGRSIFSLVREDQFTPLYEHPHFLGSLEKVLNGCIASNWLEHKMPLLKK